MSEGSRRCWGREFAATVCGAERLRAETAVELPLFLLMIFVNDLDLGILFIGRHRLRHPFRKSL
jgi:hypothetical protein